MDIGKLSYVDIELHHSDLVELTPVNKRTININIPVRHVKINGESLADFIDEVLSIKEEAKELTEELKERCEGNEWTVALSNLGNN